MSKQLIGLNKINAKDINSPESTVALVKAVEAMRGGKKLTPQELENIAKDSNFSKEDNEKFHKLYEEAN